MSSVSKSTSLQKKSRKTPEKISPPILSLLTHLVGSIPSNLPFTRIKLAKKTKTIKEVLSTIIDKDKFATISPLQQVLISSRRKRKTSPILNTSIIKKRGITLINILRTQKRCQKLVLVLATSILVIATKEEAVETIKTIEIAETARTARATKACKDSKGSEYLKINLAQVLYT